MSWCQILAGGMRPKHSNQYWFDHVDGSCEVPGPPPMPEIDKDQTCTTDYNWSDCILSGQFGPVLSSSGVNVSIENTGETDVSFSFTDLNGEDDRVTIKAGVTQIDIAMSSGSQAIMGCDGPDAGNPVPCSIKIVDYSPDPPDLCQISGELMRMTTVPYGTGASRATLVTRRVAAPTLAAATLLRP